jgi:hypothetical protein
MRSHQDQQALHPRGNKTLMKRCENECDKVELSTHHPWYPTRNLFLIVVGSALEGSSHAQTKRRDRVAYRRILLSIESAELNAGFMLLGAAGWCVCVSGRKCVYILTLTSDCGVPKRTPGRAMGAQVRLVVVAGWLCRLLALAQLA